MNADRIEKQVLLKVPRDRAWRAISDAREFGAWFGVGLDAPFASGARLTGRIQPTKVDPEVAQMQQPYAGMPFEVHVDRVEPMRLLSFRWHPFAIEKGVDYSKEPMTLVTFELHDATGGTLLKITESGFNEIPSARRADAFKANEGGWQKQTELVAKYLQLKP